MPVYEIKVLLTVIFQDNPEPRRSAKRTTRNNGTRKTFTKTFIY